MQSAIRSIDAINRWIGRAASLALLPMLVFAFTVVVLRYAFGLSYTWLQESYIWLNSVVFIGMVGYTLREERHVRVDLLYSRLTPKGRAIVNIAGVILCIWPLIGVVLWSSYSPIMRSWRLLERSPNVGGLPFVYVHKSLIFAFCLLLMLQGLSLLMKSIEVLRGRRTFEASP